jgi:hypothetical protein
MGFININGVNTHTSNILVGTSGTFSIGTTGNTTISSTTISGNKISGGYYSTLGAGNFTITPQTTTYNVLGEDVTVEGYKEPTIAIIVSSINVLGKPFFDDIMKQGIYIPNEILDYLYKKFIILERDRKIDEIIK